MEGPVFNVRPFVRSCATHVLNVCATIDAWRMAFWPWAACLRSTGPATGIMTSRSTDRGRKDMPCHVSLFRTQYIQTPIP